MLLDVHRVTEVRQTEIHAAQPLVPDRSHFGVKIATAKWKRYKSPGSDQIPSKLIHAGGEMLRSEIHKPVNCIWNKEEFPDQWKESIIVQIFKKDDRTDCTKYHGMSLLSTPYTIISNILLSRKSP
jgi:hypothetical protein